MPEIGETLRETRMRRRIDITEVEAATKIRAKYLRALENEEWDLLPGPTFVKTFLRTYSEYLDLDARLLVEEYRQRYERPAAVELTPLGGGLTPQRGRRRSGLPIGPGVALLVGVAVLLGALYLLGTWGDDEEPPSPNRVQQPSERRGDDDERDAGDGERRRERSSENRRPTRVSLRLTATAPVWVCLVDATGRAVINARELGPGTRTRRFRSSRFRANFGNGSVRMLVNGKTYRAAQSSNPVGYELRPGRRPRSLPDGQRPTCS